MHLDPDAIACVCEGREYREENNTQKKDFFFSCGIHKKLIFN